ncbi:MAG: TolB family protein [Longimicrobiales bacterium]
MIYPSPGQRDSLGRPKLVYYDISDGSRELLDLPPGVEGSASVSPDRSALVFTWAPTAPEDRDSADLDLGIYEFSTRVARRIASGPGAYWHPAWSPSGSDIAVLYASDPHIQGLGGGGQFEIRLMSSDGTLRRTLMPDPYRFRLNWSPNGKRLLFGGHPHWDQYKGFRAIEVQTATTETLPYPTAITTCREANECSVSSPNWLPDGRLGFVLITRGGPSGIYTMEVDGSDLTQVVEGSYWEAWWSPDGKLIVAQREDHLLNTLVILDLAGEVVATIGTDVPTGPLVWR